MLPEYAQLGGNVKHPLLAMLLLALTVNALAKGGGSRKPNTDRRASDEKGCLFAHPATRTPSSIARFGSFLIVTFNSFPIDDAVISKSPS
jgi:hypothetical protein